MDFLQPEVLIAFAGALLTWFLGGKVGSPLSTLLRKLADALDKKNPAPVVPTPQPGPDPQPSPSFPLDLRELVSRLIESLLKKQYGTAMTLAKALIDCPECQAGSPHAEHGK